MSIEQNKALIRRVFEEGINKNDVGALAELIAPNYVNHDFPAPTPGAEGFKQIIGMFRAAFPDLRVTLEDVLAEGDKVTSRGYFTGTHKGVFQGVAPTGKQVKVKYQDMWRIEGGRCVENWVQMDIIGLMQQLGAVPS